MLDELKECISIWNMREGPVGVQVCAEGPYLSLQGQTRSFYMYMRTSPSQTHSVVPLPSTTSLLMQVCASTSEAGRLAGGAREGSRRRTHTSCELEGGPQFVA